MGKVQTPSEASMDSLLSRWDVLKAPVVLEEIRSEIRPEGCLIMIIVHGMTFSVLYARKSVWYRFVYFLSSSAPGVNREN